MPDFTDAHVAKLLGPIDGLDCPGSWRLYPREMVESVTKEVLANRAKSCATCDLFKPWAWTEDGSGRCHGPVSKMVRPDFSCAAFVPVVTS